MKNISKEIIQKLDKTFFQGKYYHDRNVITKVNIINERAHIIIRNIRRNLLSGKLREIF